MLTNPTPPSPSVSICFPAYNEEETIAAVLEEAYHLAESSEVEYEIIVCDDGSQDNTLPIITSLASDIPTMRVIQHPRNQGIRATFEHLYSEARKEFIFLNSTDQQWKTSILFEMLPLTQSWDIIIASRKKKPYGFFRMGVSWLFNAIPLMLFGVQTYDAGAVKLVRREIINKFQLISRSPFNEAERIIRAARAGYRVTEYPVEVSQRKSGHAHGVKVKNLLAALGDVSRVWWDLQKEKFF